MLVTKALKVGTGITILGRAVDYRKDTTHGWQYYKTTIAIDGNPSYEPYKGVGCHGLAMAMMINETTSKPFNCRFKMDHLVVALPIAKGEELYVDYGNAYENYRKQMGYTLDNNKHRYNDKLYTEFHNLKFPSAKIRQANIAKWNDLIDNWIEPKKVEVKKKVEVNEAPPPDKHTQHLKNMLALFTPKH